MKKRVDNDGLGYDPLALVEMQLKYDKLKESSTAELADLKDDLKKISTKYSPPLFSSSLLFYLNSIFT